MTYAVQKISNTEAARLALIPGVAEGLAESLETHSIRVGNMALDGSKRIIYCRKAMYFGIALTTIATAGALQSDEDHAIRRYSCAAVATLGAAVTGLAAKRLYDVTSWVVGCLNRIYGP